MAHVELAPHEFDLHTVQEGTHSFATKCGRLAFALIAPFRLTQSQWLSREQGVSLVEFALILPLFLLILLGMVDLGQGFNRYLGMLNATREGAMWLARHPTDLTGMEARIVGEIQQNGLTLDNIVITRTPSNSAYGSGDLVKITLEYRYPLLFGAITHMPSLTLRTEHTIRVQ